MAVPFHFNAEIINFLDKITSMKNLKLVWVGSIIFCLSALYSSQLFGQCDAKCSGTGVASTWSKQESYCTYRYVKVTNLCSKTKKVVIEIMKDDGKYQLQGASKVKAGESITERTCSKKSNYRWVVVDDNCYNSGSNYNWTYGE